MAQSLDASDALVAPAPAVAAGRFGEIDALRCLAMIAVVGLHAKLLPFGWTGVWLFYVISGFVVTTSLMAHTRASPGQRFKAFLVRRAARIVPIYLCYVLAGVAASLWISGAFEPKALQSMLLFYNNFAMMRGDGAFAHWATGHLWTISVEMQFYLWYGAAFVFLPRKMLVALLVTLLALCPALRALTAIGAAQQGAAPLAIAYEIYAGSWTQFDAFAVGALLAIGRRVSWRLPRPEVLFFAGAVILAIYCSVYVAVNIIIRGNHDLSIMKNVVSGILYGEGREIWLYSAIVAFAMGIVNWTASASAPWGALTREPIVRRLGEISYGAYLFHAQVLSSVSWVAARLFHLDGEALGGKLAIFAATLVITFMLAELSFRYVEQPVLQAVKRLNLA